MSRTRSDIDRSLVHGIAWTSAATWFGQLLSWGATFYVISKLTPDDYGLVGSASLFLSIVLMFSEFGVGLSVIRFKDLTRSQLAQFNSVSLMLGLGAALLAILLARPVAWFLNDPERLPPLIYVMSTGFVLTGLRIVPAALLQRDMQFRKIAIMEGITSITMATANITMAATGFGKWTLALGPLVGSAMMMIMVVSQNRVPYERPNFGEIGSPFNYSRKIITTRIAWWGYSNADYLIITKLLGKAAFGIYGLGWTIAGIAVEKITTLVGRVTPAVFSAVQENLAEVRRYLLLITEGLSLLTFPVCVGLALVADDIVKFVLGEEWVLAAFPLKILAILACVRSVQPLVQQMNTSIGEAQMNMSNNILTVCILPFGFYGALTLGEYLSGMPRGTEPALSAAINSIAVAWLVLGPLLFSRLLVKSLARIELPVGRYFAALWPATSACLLMSGVVLLIEAVQPARNVMWFAIRIAAGALTYGATLLLMHRERVMKVRDMVKTLRSRKSAKPEAQPDGTQPGSIVGSNT